MNMLANSQVARASGLSASASRRSPGRDIYRVSIVRTAKPQPRSQPDFGEMPKLTRETRVLHSALRVPHSAFPK